MRTCRSTHSVAVVCCSIALSVTATASAVPPAGPGAIVTIGSNDNTPVNTVIVGTPTVEGNQLYFQTITAPDSSWTVIVTVLGDYSTDPTARLIGNIKMTNNTALASELFCSMAVPICPMIDGGSLTGGAVTLTLTTSGAGSLVCPDNAILGQGIMQITADGEGFHSLFLCPIAMATTGSGNLSSNATFGLPGPVMPGPETISEIGTSLHCMLTGLDSVTATFTLLFNDPDGVTPLACPSDIDGNGIVGGSDLTFLLAHWLQESACPGDLDGDVDLNGIVDSKDLMLILGDWGSCP
ncbi:MAG: hypothetical protein SGJ11_09550 [Phycisphaerae bacterium]|nr:hypothetical protein [Phycisphaerae bacterium]